MVQPAPDAAAPVQKRGNGFGVTALVLGIIALVLGFIPVVNFISFILAPLAIIFGIVGLVKSKSRGAGKGTSIAGLVMGVLALVVSVLMYVLIFGAAKAECENPDSTIYNTQECADIRNL